MRQPCQNMIWWPVNAAARFSQISEIEIEIFPSFAVRLCFVVFFLNIFLKIFLKLKLKYFRVLP